MVEGAAAGAAGASGTTRPGTGWSMGGMAGPALPPKIALSMEGLAGAVVRAGRDTAPRRRSNPARRRAERPGEDHGDESASRRFARGRN